ncbi:MAG: hypothetical protein ACTSXQ_08080 [Alphaproteobacteria bacterium]
MKATKEEMLSRRKESNIRFILCREFPELYQIIFDAPLNFLIEDLKERALQREKELRELSEESIEKIHTRSFDKESEAAIRKAALNDTRYFFNFRGMKDVDFDYWKGFSFWTVEEATSLLLGKNPEFVNKKTLRKSMIPESSPFLGEYNRIYEILRTSKDGKENAPNVFLEVAKEHEISIPEPLKDLVPEGENEENIFPRERVSQIALGRQRALDSVFDINGTYYTPKLAAAIDAYRVVSQNSSLVKKITVKKAIMNWLNKNKEKYNLSDDSIGKIAQVANWRPEGGVPKSC